MGETEALARTLSRLKQAIPRIHLSSRQREEIEGYACISPWLIGFVVFTAGPIIASLYLALTDYDLLSAPRFVAFQNLRKMLLADRLVLHSLKVTSTYVLGVPLRVAAGLAVALLLNQEVRGLAVFRTVCYLPSVVSGVAVSLMWMWVFNPELGIINGLLARLGIKGPDWYYSKQWVVPTFMITSLWGVGSGIVLYLSALQGVPTVLYDAATIDGASRWQRFWNVTVPMISPVIFFTLIMGIIGSFQVFTSAYVITSGGPANASLFYVLYLYRNAFQYFQMGYASALAWLLFVIILAVTALTLLSGERWVYYAGSVK